MSKSQTKADIGLGAEDADNGGKVPGAESSPRSQRNGNGSTFITSLDVPEMLRSVLAYWQQNGGTFQVLNSQKQQNTMILVLPGMQWCRGCNAPKLFEQMEGDKCQKCTSNGGRH